MEAEAGGLSGQRIDLRGVITAVPEQFDPRKRGAEKHAKEFPATRLTQSGAEPGRRVAEKSNDRHAGEDAALEQDQFRVQMPDDRPFHLRELVAHGLLLPEKRQRGWIMAEQEHALFWAQGGEGGADLLQMFLSQALPLAQFVGEQFRFKNRQGD